MKTAVIAVGNEIEYKEQFNQAFSYLKKELAAIDPDPYYRIQRTDAVELFQLIRSVGNEYHLVFFLVAPEASASQLVNKVLSNGLDRSLENHPLLQRQIEHLAIQRSMDLSYEEMAAFSSFPSGSVVHKNLSGFIQGTIIQSDHELYAELPVPLNELSSLYRSSIRPVISRFAGLSLSYGTVRVLELDEFNVEQEIRRLNENSKIHASSQNNYGDYEIFIEAIGEDQDASDKLLDSAIRRLKDTFGIYLYCVGDQDLSSIVVDSLTSKNLTLSMAETGTSGLCYRSLSAIVGGTTVCRRADLESTIRSELQVPPHCLDRMEEGDATLASVLALETKRVGRTDLGIGICSSTSGRIYVALADRNRIWHRQVNCSESIKGNSSQIAVWQALNVLRLYSLRFPKALPGGTDIQDFIKRAGLSGFAKNYKASKGVKNLFSSLFNKSITEKESPERLSSDVSSVDESDGTNLLQRIKSKKLTKNDRTRIIALGLCALVFIGCLLYIFSVKWESVTNAKKSGELADLYGQDIDLEGYPQEYLTKFKALYAQNEDIVGWISISGTDLNYAVMQSYDNETYSRTDFYRNHNNHGIPFLDYRCDIATPSYNSIIYAHNMGDGQMFGVLMNYKKLAYYKEHPTITYDTLYREDEYKIFAVVLARADDEEFPYHNTINVYDDAEKNGYIEDIMERSLIKTSVSVNADDRILTLSTCDYSFRDPVTNDHIARLVVFARAIRPGESKTVNTSSAYLNPNPLMPEEWYTYLKAQQEKKEKAELEAEQKAFIALWLTEEEQIGGTIADLYNLATIRATEASNYLTSAELASCIGDDDVQDPELILELLTERKSLFNAFIADDESNLSVQKRLELVDSRKALLLSKDSNNLPSLFTEDQLKNIKDFSQIENLVNLLENGTTAKDLLKYANRSEITDTRSDVTILISQRESDAKKYVSSSDIKSASTWDQLSAKIESGKAKRQALEQKATELGLTDYSGLSYDELQSRIKNKEDEGKIKAAKEEILILDPSATGLDNASLEELTSKLNALKSIRATLESEAAAVGMSSEDISKYKSNAELQAIVNEKQSAQKTSVINEIIALDSTYTADSLQNKSLSELNSLKAEIQQKISAKNSLISEIKSTVGNTKSDSDLAAMTLEELTQYKAELDAANTPPEDPPTEPISPTDAP